MVQLSAHCVARNSSPRAATPRRSPISAQALSPIVVPAGSLNVGTDTLTAVYTPDSPSFPGYFAASGSASVIVGAAGQKATPTMAVTPSASSITSAQALSVTVTIGGSIGMPAPTGTVTLTSGSYASAPTALSNGSLALDVPAGSLALGVDTLTAAYSGDGNYNPTAGTASITVTDARLASFTVNGTGITVTPGATTRNTSIITITPANGFTGAVALSAVISGGPVRSTGASDSEFRFDIFRLPLPGSVLGRPRSRSPRPLSRITRDALPLVRSIPAFPGLSRPLHRLPWFRSFAGWRRRWRAMLAMMSLLVVLATSAVAMWQWGRCLQSLSRLLVPRGVAIP